MRTKKAAGNSKAKQYDSTTTTDSSALCLSLSLIAILARTQQLPRRRGGKRGRSVWVSASRCGRSFASVLRYAEGRRCAALVLASAGPREATKSSRSINATKPWLFWATQRGRTREMGSRKSSFSSANSRRSYLQRRNTQDPRRGACSLLTTRASWWQSGRLHAPLKSHLLATGGLCQ